MQLLALDFDGVICRSRTEVQRIALEAWRDLGLTPPLPEAANWSGGMASAFDRLTPLGNRAEDFGVALHILGAGLPVDDQAGYDEVREDLGRAWLETFHRAFYETRERWRRQDLEGWLALHRPYEAFAEVLLRRGKERRLAITTAKDGESVRLLLDAFGLGHLFKSELILDKETGVHKSRHLEAVARRTGTAFADITFVDDKLNHLCGVAGLGVRAVLAEWGYNTERERGEALALGFEVASLDDAEGRLFDRRA